VAIYGHYFRQLVRPTMARMVNRAAGVRSGRSATLWSKPTARAHAHLSRSVTMSTRRYRLLAFYSRSMGLKYVTMVVLPSEVNIPHHWSLRVSAGHHCVPVVTKGFSTEQRFKVLLSSRQSIIDPAIALHHECVAGFCT
jgi:hypothetical protein